MEHLSLSFFFPLFSFFFSEFCYLILCKFIYIVKSSSIEKILNFIVIYSFRENPETAYAI